MGKDNASFAFYFIQLFFSFFYLHSLTTHFSTGVAFFCWSRGQQRALPVSCTTTRTRTPTLDFSDLASFAVGEEKRWGASCRTWQVGVTPRTRRGLANKMMKGPRVGKRITNSWTEGVSTTPLCALLSSFISWWAGICQQPSALPLQAVRSCAWQTVFGCF